MSLSGKGAERDEVVVRHLPENTADIDAVNDDGIALCVAAASGSMVVVKQLLDKGVDVEAMDSNNQTALLCAARGGHETVVFLLLDKEANTEAVDKYKQTALLIAAENGHELIVWSLLEKGADIEAKDYYARTALLWAARGGCEEIVWLLLAKGADIKARDNYNQTALLYAASSGYTEVVWLLLKRGAAEINVPNNSNQTALLCAAGGGHEDVVLLLLSRGAGVDATDKDNQTALHKAALSGHEEIVRPLLEHGADVEAIDNDQQTALLCAARGGHERVVFSLLNKWGANTEATDKDKQTALLITAKNGHKLIVWSLLEKGANIEATDNNQQTALLCAARGGHTDVVYMLLDKKAQIEAADKDGKTALLLAAQGGHQEVEWLLLENEASIEAAGEDIQNVLHRAARYGREKVVWLLLDKKANVDGTDKENQTALHKAAHSGHEKVVLLLLERRATIDATDKDGQTALHIATCRRKEAVVWLLLQKCADTEVTDKDKQTALLCAACIGNQKVVFWLLDRGAKTEAKDKDNQTALHKAAQNGHEKVVLQLLNNGADINATDKDEETALHMAAREGHGKVVQLLLKKKANVYAKTSSGYTVWHSTTKESITQLLQDRPHIKEVDISHLEKGPVITPPRLSAPLNGLQPSTQSQQVVAGVSYDACDDFQAVIMDFFLLEDQAYQREYRFEKWLSVCEILRQGPEAIMTSHRKTGDTDKPAFRWVHLPANNMAWVEGLVAKIYDDRKIGAVGKWWAGKPVRGSNLQSCFMEPLCQSVPIKIEPHTGEGKRECKENIRLFMPYLHFETDTGRAKMNETIQRVMNAARDGKQMPNIPTPTIQDKLIRAYLRTTLDWPTPPLHVRRTLDQYFYTTLDNTDARDQGQVVYRYTKSAGPLVKPIVLMVDQLWLWILNGDTIITSFPQRWEDDGRTPSSGGKLSYHPPNALESILEHLKLPDRPPIMSAYDLAILVTSQCIGVFNRSPVQKDRSLLEIFKYSVNKAATNERNFFERFEKCFKNIGFHLDDLSNIEREAKLLTTTTDIRHELGIISTVLGHQTQVEMQLKDAIRDMGLLPLESCEQRYERWSKERPDLVSHRVFAAELEKIDKLANRTVEALHHLLNLKQKQANASEASSARIQTQDTARQGQAILVFTIVTVVFLPLSFMAAFFALNIAEFQRDSDGELRLQYVSKYMFGISVAVIVPTVIIALRDFIAKWIGKTWRQISLYNSQRKKSNEESLREMEICEEHQEGSSTRSLPPSGLSLRIMSKGGRSTPDVEMALGA